MKASTCRFCDHANPAGSRFCNACGSPLDLRPCPRCDAVNNALADRCYQCGESLTADEHREVAAVAAGADVGHARDVPSNAGRSPTLDNIPVALARRIDPGAHGADAEPMPQRLELPEQAFEAAALGEPAAKAVPLHVDRGARTSRGADRRGVRAGTAVGIALVVIAAAGYYVYVTGIPAGVTAAIDRTIASHRAPVPGPTAPAPANAQAGTAHSQLPAGSAGLSSSGPRPPPATRSARESAPDVPSPPTSTTAIAPSVMPGAAGDAPEGRPAVPARKPRPRETARATVRDTPDAAVPRGSVDRDALETRRLIARDLAGFVSPSAPGAPPSQ